MNIQLEQVIPIPLKEKLGKRQSCIWNSTCALEQKHKTKIKAPSGTGKTTLIHYLYHLRNDYEGSITYNNTPVHNLSTEAIALIRQTQLSVIFQDMRLFPNLTALENIELKRTMTKPMYTQGYAIELAQELGVHHILHQQASICSYGEQQRIAIIRALMQPFSMLLMDEPFSHLDHANTTKAASLIAAECSKRNAGFVLTDLDDDNHFAYTQYLEL